MTEILHRPGFLGTAGNLAADATLIMMLVIAAVFTTGMVLALRKKYDAHRWVQTTGAVLNVGMVLWMMVLPFRDFVVRDLGGPRPTLFYAVTIVHAALGVSAVLFGIFVVLRGNNLMIKPLRFKRYKPFMRAAYFLYISATLMGVVVYLVWFTGIPNPPIYQ
jgi:uncharacterized membrane protein YozB (DUF420 family)